MGTTGLKETKCLFCPLFQGTKNCGGYRWYSAEQSRHVLCLHGAYSLFVEQALSKQNTKEDRIVKFNESNQGISYLPTNLTLYPPHNHFLFVIDRKTWEKNVCTYWKSSGKSELHCYAVLTLTFSSLNNSFTPAHKWRHSILTSRQAWDFPPPNGWCKRCLVFRVYGTPCLKTSIA